MLVIAFMAGAQAQGPTAPIAPDLADVVVTARKRHGRAAPLDAVGYVQRFCFDPYRLDGKPAPPIADGIWSPLGPELRARFRLDQPDAPAFSADDPATGATLLLKFETFARPDRVVERRCTLAAIGGGDHARLPGRMAALFRGEGTQRHVGHIAGVPAIPGWEQWLWTANPGRGAHDWRDVNANSRGAPDRTWVVVTDPSFYNEHDYVIGDLKTNHGARPTISVISIAFLTREPRRP